MDTTEECFGVAHGDWEECRTCEKRQMCSDACSIESRTRKFLQENGFVLTKFNEEHGRKALEQARACGYEDDPKALLKFVTKYLKDKADEHRKILEKGCEDYRLQLAELDYGRPRRPNRYRIPPRWMWENPKIWRSPKKREHITLLTIIYYKIFNSNFEESHRLANGLVAKGTFNYWREIGEWGSDKNGKSVFYPAALFQFPYRLVETEGLRMKLDLGIGEGRPGILNLEVKWDYQKSRRLLRLLSDEGILMDVGKLGKEGRHVYSLGTEININGKQMMRFHFRDDPSWVKIFEEFTCF